jgi:anti-anti-sigma factor
VSFTQQATLSIEDLDGAVILLISGEVDVANKEQLELALHECLAKNSGTVIVNLLDITYADSTCLHALLHAQKTAQRMNKSLILVIQEGGQLQKIFQLTGLISFFDIRYSVEAALTEKTGSTTIHEVNKTANPQKQ